MNSYYVNVAADSLNGTDAVNTINEAYESNPSVQCVCYPSLTAHQHQKGHTVPKQV